MKNQGMTMWLYSMCLVDVEKFSVCIMICNGWIIYDCQMLILKLIWSWWLTTLIGVTKISHNLALLWIVTYNIVLHI